MADLPLDIAELEEKYEILAKLGEGGMGAVYKVRHRVLGKLRVIKTIRSHLQGDQDLQNRFLREAQVAAGLRHPNIAAVQDCAFTKNGTAYIVMEHIEGQNLREYQRSGGKLRVEQVVDIGRQALAALGYLHSKNFIHRDIATDNMMISWHEGLPTVTLIDLGLAKSLETSQWQTKTGMVVGKVRYISPEQLNAGSEDSLIDARSDLYSMGVVLYELLTGHFPITGQDDMSMIAGHLYRPPRPFEETDPRAKIPQALRAVVMRALEKKADFRWPNAGAFGQALEDSLHTPQTAPVALPPEEERTVRLARRDPEAPTVTFDVRRPGEARPAVPAADPTMLAVPARETREVPEQYTLPVDSEALTAPINVDPTRNSSTQAPTKKFLLFALLGLLGVVAAGLLLWPGLPASKPATPVPATQGPATQGPATQEPRLSPIFYGQYHAIVIGNDNYAKMPKLETAVNDARTLARLLENQFGFEVTLLLDATHDQIFDTLWDYQTRLTGRDNLILFFAGHGQLAEGNAYWLPIDADPTRTTNWISTGSEMNLVLEKLDARHVLVIADSCYAGAMVAGLEEPLSAADPNLSRDEELNLLTSRASRLVLTSGEDNPVLDSGGSRHSIFAKALLDALEKVEEPSEVSAIYRQIKPLIEARSKQLGLRQEPVLAPMNSSRDQGGELVFVPQRAGS